MKSKRPTIWDECEACACTRRQFVPIVSGWEIVCAQCGGRMVRLRRPKHPSLRLRFAWMVARAEIDLRDRRAWLSRRCTKYIPAPRSAIPGIAILLAGGIVTAALTETGEPRLMEEGVIGGLASVAAPV